MGEMLLAKRLADDLMLETKLDGPTEARRPGPMIERLIGPYRGITTPPLQGVVLGEESAYWGIPGGGV